MADKVSLQCVLPEDCCKVCAHKENENLFNFLIKNLMYQCTELLHKCFNNFTFEAFAQVFSNMIGLTQKVRNIGSKKSNNLEH